MFSGIFKKKQKIISRLNQWRLLLLDAALNILKQLNNHKKNRQKMDLKKSYDKLHSRKNTTIWATLIPSSEHDHTDQTEAK